MRCNACGADAPEGASYCTVCGVHLETGERANGDGPDSGVFPLLAAANLFRMRGNWDAAEQKCVEVLRLYPNNATAHALLGDVYADQGRWEQAVQWYQLAVDLDPDNEADRRKLAYARQRLTGGGGGRIDLGEDTEASRPAAIVRRFSPLMQLAAIALIAFLGGLIYLSFSRREKEPPLNTPPGAGFAFPGSPGFEAARRPQPGYKAAPAPANRTPAQSPLSGATANAGAAPANTPSGNTPAANTPPANAPAAAQTPGNAPGETTLEMPGPDMTDPEARLLARLQTQVPVVSAQGEGRVTDVRWDPLAGRTLATVLFARRLEPDVLRDEALRAAYRTGQVMAQVRIERFEVVVKAPLVSGAPEIVFAAAAESARPAVWGLDAGTARSDALLTAFANLWWHPQLRS